MLAELKQTFLEAYDENSDGKIDIREVSYLSLSASRAAKLAPATKQRST